MSDRSTWRCAVLRGWTPENAQALTPVATIAWEEGDPLSRARVRWVPVTTPHEADLMTAWRARILLADQELSITEFLNYHGTKNSSDVVAARVPEEAVNVSGAADLLLDEVLAAPLTELAVDHRYTTTTAKAEA